jgi:hypothetical protein
VLRNIIPLHFKNGVFSLLRSIISIQLHQITQQQPRTPFNGVDVNFAYKKEKKGYSLEALST